MKSIFKFNARSIGALGCGLVALSVAGGCGGGGGGSSESLPTTPTPFDATYTPVFVPSDVVPSDGKAPTGTLKVLNGRATGQTTFYLQTTVVTRVQDAINKGLTDNGYSAEISNNQVPANIKFDFAKNLDSSGKVVLTASKDVNVCGKARLTIDSTFSSTTNGQATYRIDFPSNLVVKIRGRDINASGTCNNLPNRVGTVTLTR